MPTIYISMALLGLLYARFENCLGAAAWKCGGMEKAWKCGGMGMRQHGKSMAGINI